MNNGGLRYPHFEIYVLYSEEREMFDKLISSVRLERKTVNLDVTRSNRVSDPGNRDAQKGIAYWKLPFKA